MPPIQFDHVTKRFGDVQVVEDFHLDVADGELLVLVGGSGSGKSTILRMLAGLESLTSGRILLGDRDVTALAPRDRDVAMVFQDYALYPHMTVRENLSIGLRIRKVPGGEIDRRVAWAAGILGLEPLLARKPKALSGGQRQRVAMGRAMVREPAAFLFDEPLSNLDAGLRGQMRGEIGALQRRLGTTSIYVTHDQVEAMTLGDRIVVLAHGRIQQVGKPIDLYRAPANRFVAGFIGTPPMNFIEGRVEHDARSALGSRPSADDGQAPRAESRELAFVAEGFAVPLGAGRAGIASGLATLGIRPEDLRIDLALDGEAPVGRIALIERLGGTSHVHLEVGAHRVLVAVTGEPIAGVDERVALRVPADRVHLFDASGRAQ